ncbi:hypothetical protein COY95_02430 [Candidatus Woesearchaeota archaeon CG_4_10_14_0_8_um_filter_47_5]|nr:MAG: hypothetical protein COY95_02430 [Candidatus Woesearchaeota archaeon CG_4_10_14_0_8_um_filter_47_5]
MWYLSFILLVLGLFVVWYGAGLVIKACTRTTKEIGIHDSFVGLTVLSIGTSLPEISTHIKSSINILRGIESSGIAVGTNIGSNIIQITFIMGLIAFLVRIHATKKVLKGDYVVMLGSILLLWLFSLDGVLSRFEGILLVGLYLLYLYHLGDEEHILSKFAHPYHKVHWMQNLCIFFVGVVLLIVGADLVVDKGILLSIEWGVRETLIGTMLIGVGTALPELTTSIRAVLSKAEGMSVGTLIGSNITNPMFAVGIGAIISGYTVDRSLIIFDMPFWFIISLVGLLLFWKHQELTRKGAMIMIGGYIGYVIISLTLFR